ncbi:MAG: TonB-dependent receptor plug domain-containing protein [Niabella sp.]
MGEVTVKGVKQADSVNTVSQSQMEQFNSTTVSTALQLLPGVHLANIGARNESVVYVRGFNLRQTPVFIDGVPVYVPYDGYVDMGRFTTFDLEKIQVSKGFASILYGPNTLGGAINLISRRPQKRIEIGARAGLFSGNGYRWNVNAGSRLGKFYYQAGISQLKQTTFPLSDKFKPVRYQMSKNRENAYRDDFKISVKVGFAPKEGHEYVLGYVNQQGEKGNPPYLGGTPRFWTWPKWNKESIFFISSVSTN